MLNVFRSFGGVCFERRPSPPALEWVAWLAARHTPSYCPAAVHEESDEALVAAVARGNTAAIAALYDRHARQMLGLAERITGGRPQAEDLVHDVFVEAWRSAASYDPARGSVKSWLLLRTRSRAIDYRKSAGVSRAVSGAEAVLAALADPIADLDPADRTRLRTQLAALSAEQREVLVLGYFEGLSSSEIAERIAVPIGTVKSRVAAALSALRRALRESEVKP